MQYQHKITGTEDDPCTCRMRVAVLRLCPVFWILILRVLGSAPIAFGFDSTNLWCVIWLAIIRFGRCLIGGMLAAWRILRIWTGHLPLLIFLH